MFEYCIFTRKKNALLGDKDTTYIQYVILNRESKEKVKNPCTFFFFFFVNNNGHFVSDLAL